MSRTNVDDARFTNCLYVKGFKFGLFTLSTSSAFTLARDAGPLCIITAGAALNLTLPAAEAGLFYLIHNSAGGAFSITVKDPSAATKATIAQGANAMLYSDGTNWFGA